jgi:hypothetical protein
MSGYLLAGFGLGLIFVVAHLVLSYLFGVEPLLSVAVLLIVSAVGVAVGIRIIVLCITNGSLGPFHGEDQVYLAVGGFALVWVSAASVWALLWE